MFLENLALYFYWNKMIHQQYIFSANHSTLSNLQSSHFFLDMHSINENTVSAKTGFYPKIYISLREDFNSKNTPPSI